MTHEPDSFFNVSLDLIVFSMWFLRVRYNGKNPPFSMRMPPAVQGRLSALSMAFVRTFGEGASTTVPKMPLCFHGVKRKPRLEP